MADGTSNERWDRSAQPSNEDSNGVEEDEWHTVQKGGRLRQKGRQPESESTGMWARGQGVRERQSQDDGGNDARSVGGNAWQWRSPDGPLPTYPRQQAQQRSSGVDEPHQSRPGSSGFQSEFGGRGSNRGGDDRGGRGGWVKRDGVNPSASDDFSSRGGRDGSSYRGRGGSDNRGRDGSDYRGRGGSDYRGRGSDYRGRDGSDYRGRGGSDYRGRGSDYRGHDGSDYRGRGGSNYRGRGDGRDRGQGGGRDFNGGRGAGSFPRRRGDGRVMSGQRGGGSRGNQAWTFWTVLCGSPNSQIVFTPYKGFCNARTQSLLQKGWIHVPLFHPTTDEEVCLNFREKLQSIAASVAECEELSSDRCKLHVHLRVGDLYFTHSSFRFDCRPGIKLEDFSELLEETKFPEASLKLDRFFDADEELSKARRPVTSTFVTEKSVANHSTLEAFLSMRGFEEVSGREEETLLTATLNGQQNKFELFYSFENLTMQNIKLITNKWNLNLVTAKGTNYQGTFDEVADFRLQFEASFASDTDEKVTESLAEEVFQKEDLQQLFERIGEAPPVLATSASDNDAPDLWGGSERHYQLKLPHLADRLDYIREQRNKTFVRHHDRWPFMVMLRQFRFYKLVNPVAAVYNSLPGVELRVSAELDCLDREVLGETEFVSYMWECCQLMQDLVVASMEVVSDSG